MSGKQTTKAILIKEDRPMVLMGDMARLEGSFLAHPMSYEHGAKHLDVSQLNNPTDRFTWNVQAQAAEGCRA